jgi:virulence factor Mce-like protein
MRRNQKRGMSLWVIGLLTLLLLTAASYLAFTKEIPFRGHYEVQATFQSANQLRKGSLVRIAGVNVGEVTKIQPVDGDQRAAHVTLRISDKGRPIHKDATAKIRPRIFFEGNFFVDLQPGSGSAPELGDGEAIPINQTAVPVQFDQVLGALQHDTRKDLREVLAELSTAFGKGGSEGFNRSIKYWAPAYRDSAIVNDATRGVLEDDLSRYIESMGDVAEALDRNPEQLKDLITNLHITARALAARDEQLADAIAELPRTLRAGQPALAALNDALPSLRRFAVEARPGVRSTVPAIEAQTPFVRQLRGLVKRSELRGLASDLRPTVPSLTRMNRGTIPLLKQLRALSSCQNEVVLPFFEDKIEDPHFPAPGPVYQEQVKPFIGLAGESRSHDANSQWFRVSLSAGLFAYPSSAGRFLLTDQPLTGSNPPKPARRPPIRPDVPCETQQRPDLRSRAAPAPEGFEVDQDSPAALARQVKARAAMVKWLKEQLEREGRTDVEATDQLLDKADLPKLGVAGK